MASGGLDTGSASKRIWLVKVPNFVAKQWRAVGEQSIASGSTVGAELGRITYAEAEQVFCLALGFSVGVPPQIPPLASVLPLTSVPLSNSKCLCLVLALAKSADISVVPRSKGQQVNAP